MNQEKKIPFNNHLQNNDSFIDSWFERLIDDIKTDHFLITSGAATDEKKELYSQMIHGNDNDMFCKMRASSSMFFIKEIISDYISEIKHLNKKPIKLALGLTDSKIMVWSVIEDNDETMEDSLLIAEAKVNGKYQKNGFYLTSTITEFSENFETPNHYQSILD